LPIRPRSALDFRDKDPIEIARAWPQNSAPGVESKKRTKTKGKIILQRRLRDAPSVWGHKVKGEQLGRGSPAATRGEIKNHTENPLFLRTRNRSLIIASTAVKGLSGHQVMSKYTKKGKKKKKKPAVRQDRLLLCRGMRLAPWGLRSRGGEGRLAWFKREPRHDSRNVVLADMHRGTARGRRPDGRLSPTAGTSRVRLDQTPQRPVGP